MTDQTGADLVADDSIDNNSIVSDSVTNANHELMIIRDNRQIIGDSQRVFLVIINEQLF